MRLPIAALLVLTACGPELEATVAGAPEEGDAFEVVAGELSTAETAMVLRYVNGPEAVMSHLVLDAHVTARGANNIEAHAHGFDRILGNADDDRIDSLAELDAIPYVGTSAMASIADFAIPHYGPGSVLVKDVSFAPDEQVNLMAEANRIDLSASTGINFEAGRLLFAGRPYTSFAQVMKIDAIGNEDYRALRAWAKAHPAHPPTGPAGSCNGQGGTYDGVAFTAAEECHAVEFLNLARFSEMAPLTAAARDLAYRSNPEGTWTLGTRFSRWVNLKDFSSRPNIGATALRGIKTAAAAWTKHGLSYDTVASTYANRVALDGVGVWLDKVYVTKLFPAEQDGTWRWECAEVRDSPSARNYFRACFQLIGADSSSGCTDGGCWTGKLHTWVGVQGYVRPSSISGTGGWKVAATYHGTWEPSANVP
ncbi:MAG: hypothetical protein K1X89_30700 [Myxococcaceae bacterium]|nr:hypothetical protein [Myxococcaceae bacterium]